MPSHSGAEDKPLLRGCGRTHIREVACCSLETVIPRSVFVEMSPSGPSRGRSVTRLLSKPRREADALEAKGIMPDDAKERLRKSLQSCLRQTLLRLLSGLDMSEVGTTKLLAVPLGQLRTLVPVSRIEGLACTAQWTALLELLCGRRWTRGGRPSETLHYEPNLRVQGLPTIVHRPAMTVLLRCTECGHPLRSNWYFVHPGSGKVQALTPMNGHAPCRNIHHRVCFFRSEDRGASIADNFTRLDFCEHMSARKDCVLCGGSAICAHGKRRRGCPVCAPFVKRRKK